MKIIVLGGAGDMGSRAVEDLATSEGVRRVTIADRNVSTAREVAEQLSGQGAEIDVKRIDANNHDELVEAMRGYDVAASAVGPFHLFEMKLVRAAIEAGVDYASICDGWEAAGAVIDQFDEAAREKGVTVITGLGTSPGFSNVGVRYYAQQLDRMRRADVYVYQPLNAGGGQAVVRHMLHIISGQVVAWRGGRRVMVPGLASSSGRRRWACSPAGASGMASPASSIGSSERPPAGSRTWGPSALTCGARWPGRRCIASRAASA